MGAAENIPEVLLKLEQVLPWRLRGRINAVRTFTASAGERVRITTAATCSG